MRWASIGLGVLAAGVLAFGQETTAGWVKYSSSAANVAVLFPGKPGVKDIGGGKEVLYERADGKVAYMLRFDPFPAAIDPTATDVTDRVLDGATAALKKGGWAVKKERHYKAAKKYPAVELDASSGSVPDHKIHLVVTEKWLIQVHAGGPKGTPATEDARLFINSFTLKE
ncbi:MAG: hypothetical protein JWO38_4300 [Gemmataceae bacterium]|nr:hypothetical protein [Gemmataceae bacterium]